jgi:hypothetical protein
MGQDAGRSDKPVWRIVLSHSLLVLDYEQVVAVDAKVDAADGTVLPDKNCSGAATTRSTSPSIATRQGLEVRPGKRRRYRPPASDRRRS